MQADTLRQVTSHNISQVLLRANMVPQVEPTTLKVNRVTDSSSLHTTDNHLTANMALLRVLHTASSISSLRHSSMDSHREAGMVGSRVTINSRAVMAIHSMEALHRTSSRASIKHMGSHRVDMAGSRSREQDTASSSIRLHRRTPVGDDEM